jgi:hypothetical protein
MIYKTTGPGPLCRQCGKPIRKVTHEVRFGRAPCSAVNGRSYVERPANREEAQRLLNPAVVSLRYSDLYNVDAAGATPERPFLKIAHCERYVERATVWDGESYWDDLFCSSSCAEAFGRGMARAFPSYGGTDYHEAVRKRDERGAA